MLRLCAPGVAAGESVLQLHESIRSLVGLGDSSPLGAWGAYLVKSGSGMLGSCSSEHTVKSRVMLAAGKHSLQWHLGVSVVGCWCNDPWWEAEVLPGLVGCCSLNRRAQSRKRVCCFPERLFAAEVLLQAEEQKL